MLQLNESDIIFDRFGSPRCRIFRDGFFVDFNGRFIGFLHGAAVHNIRGNHVGWYENGVLRDTKGATVGFGLYPMDAPMPFLPIRGIIPIRGITNIAPIRPIPSIPSIKPIKTFGWSSFDPITLFG